MLRRRDRVLVIVAGASMALMGAAVLWRMVFAADMVVRTPPNWFVGVILFSLGLAMLREAVWGQYEA